jgi:hypothetical protein
MRTILALLLGSAGSVPQEEAVDREGIEFFEKRIRPVLADRCYSCHSARAEKLKAGLLLDSRAAMLRGGDQGPALKPGDPDGTLLLRAIRYTDEDLKMPPKGKLPAEVVKDFEAWVKRGAPMPADAAAAAPAPRKKEIDVEKGRAFWSFRPLQAPLPPDVKQAAWVRTPVDRFILERLEARGIAPNPPADPRRVLRRATFGLTGLPPAPEEVEAFARDPSPEAYARALDRLLDSPHYGERWARHWLDVARFAESHGFEQDYDRENAFYYRDFVIQAFNQDMPFDQFVRWQVAGDELAPEDPLAWMATGFLGAGAFPTQLTEVEFEPARYDELDNMTSTVGAAMLGLSVGCARCHDHKYDPLPTRDFYRLAATFTAAIRSHKEFDLEPEALRRALAEWEPRHAPLAEALGAFEKNELPARFDAWRAERAWEKPGAKLPPELVKEAKAGRRDKALEHYKKIDEEWKKRNKAVQDSLAKKPRPATVLVTTEGLKPLKHHADDRGFPHFYQETYFLARGDVNKKQGAASPGFLQVLSRAPEDRWLAPAPAGARTPHRRAALARWLTDVEAGAGPLLARVIVNRLWQHHFGRGIVSTPNDFGAQGEPPSHPELLEWLAGELLRNGWRLKPIHKLLLTSAVYLESAEADPARSKADPDNRLFWRREPRRLEAEAIRDSLLAVSGLLDRRMYGPGTLDESMTRRSLYFFVKRSRLISMMQVFDAPEPLVPIGARPTTTIAPQALLFLNSPQVRRAAAAFAARVLGTSDPVREAYRAALGRAPAPEEARAAAAFLEDQSASYARDGRGDARGRALADFCQALLCLNEFVYVD